MTVDAPVGSICFRYRLDVAVALIAIAAVAIRLSGYPDLMDNEQQLQASYVMDAIHNGHWLMQTDDSGCIASKPPLYTWAAALAALPFPTINRVAVTLPSALSAVLLALIVLRVGRTYFGELSGATAALAYILSIPFIRQAGLARMDGTVPLFSTLGALAGWRAWNSGRGWIWFWLYAAASMLTKGPPGALVSAAGLAALFFDQHSEPAARSSRRRIALEHLIGFLLMLAIVGGWFAAAFAVMGRPVYEKLILEEFLPRAMQKYKGVFPGQLWYLPLANFFSRYMPWSVITAIAGWRIWAHPSKASITRRFELFVLFWWIGGLAVFMIAPHQRADLILPVYPAAALLVGRELTRWLAPRRRFLVVGWCAAAVVVGLSLMGVKYHLLTARDREVRNTMAVRDLAERIQRAGGTQLPIAYIDSPFALQFYLNTIQRRLVTPKSTWADPTEPEGDYERAARLLAGNAPVIVAVESISDVQKHLGGARVYDLLQVQLYPTATLHLLSNRPTLKGG